ncbi:MAG: hypothetical protein K8R55_07445, partial [Desulfuromonadaceae bacterium]|nr:hypothetical protein [Desulfuromonadaceae bacterium]
MKKFFDLRIHPSDDCHILIHQYLLRVNQDVKGSNQDLTPISTTGQHASKYTGNADGLRDKAS